MFQPRSVKTDKKFISIPQSNFPKGYVSTLSASRIPLDGLATMVNMTLEQDAVPRPRPPFIPYGDSFPGECIGIGTYIDIEDGVPLHYEISMQAIAHNAVQTLTITGSPTGGTFKLAFGAQVTGTIARNATAANVQTALQALSNIGTGNVTCTGTTLPSGTVTITFTGTLANTDVATLTINTNSLSGGISPTPVITVSTTGGPVGVVYVSQDGGSWTSKGGTYNGTAFTTFTTGASLNADGTQDARVYINNGIDTMSYYDITTDEIIEYVSLDTPTTPTVAQTGLTGTNFTQYYRVSANNAGGESAASAAGSVNIETARDYWATDGTEYITISWTAVTGATSYNIYTSDISGQESYLVTISGLTFNDTGSTAINVFKTAPSQNSSAGPIVTTMINMDNQLFGVGDPSNPQYMWYSGQGQHFGDFSFNPQGGGYVGIDYGGDTLPTTPFAFHDGKGNPVLSILTHGPAGRGKLYHVQFTSTSVGTTTITYPNVYEASNQDGTPASRGVAIYNNNAYYCTGLNFKTTGIKPNVINILSTDTIADQLLPDLYALNLGALPGIVAQEYLGKIYFAVPSAGSTVNNEVWVLDMTRGGLWILRWPVSIQAMWTYQDSEGVSHFLTLQNNKVLELDLKRTAIPHQDDNVSWQASCGSGAMTFDKGGVAMFSSYYTYFKFLFPAGTITTNIYAITEDNPTASLVATDTEDYGVNNSVAYFGQMRFSDPAAGTPLDPVPLTYSGDPGMLVFVTTSISVIPMEVDDIINQQSWEIISNSAGTDYLLSSVTTTGYTIPQLYFGQ